MWQQTSRNLHLDGICYRRPRHWQGWFRQFTSARRRCPTSCRRYRTNLHLRVYQDCHGESKSCQNHTPSIVTSSWQNLSYRSVIEKVEGVVASQPATFPPPQSSATPLQSLATPPQFLVRSSARSYQGIWHQKEALDHGCPQNPKVCLCSMTAS